MAPLVVGPLSDIRSNDVFEKSKDMLNISKIKLEVLRTSSRQTLQDNVEHTSTEEYCRRSTIFS